MYLLLQNMSTTISIFLILFSLCITTSAQSCTNYNFASNQLFASCNDLPYLNSYLHWNYDQSSKTVQIAFRHTGVDTSRWVAWAINPTGQGMLGSQALVAFQRSDGTMRAYTSPVSSYQTQLEEGDLSFPVSDLTATYSNSEITIFATLRLDNVSSTVNQVWQEGPVTSDAPSAHLTTGPNVQSMGSLNLLSGQSTSTGGGLSSRAKKGNIHGILNAVSWGIMLPIGAVFSRYLKVFPSADPAWFYLHASCQTSAYIIGVAGWATGLQLGSQSPGIQFTAHRVIGIILFCLATLQVSALLLRPRKDHKFRFYWNVYHQIIGYTVIVLSIVNIFKGFNILNPLEKWRRVYIGILIGLAIIAVVLETYTWYVVLKRKKSANTHKVENGVNGTNGHNGYGGRAHESI